MSRTPSTSSSSAHHLLSESLRPRKKRKKSAVKKILDCWITAKVPVRALVRGGWKRRPGWGVGQGACDVREQE
eukprot:1463902-Pleurochrysis_carterae.AAC.2